MTTYQSNWDAVGQAHRWALGLSLDFSGESNHDFKSVATKVMGGITWTAINTGNASTFAIQNGTGLVVTPNSGPTWISTSVTAPALYCTVQDAVGAYNLSDWLAFLAEYTNDAAGSNDRLSILAYSTTAPATNRVDCEAGRNITNPLIGLQAVRGGVWSTGANYHDAAMQERLDFQKRGNQFYAGSGPSGTFPTGPSQLTKRFVTTGSQYTYETGDDSAYSSTTDRLYLTGYNYDGGAATTTWKRLDFWVANLAGLR